MGMENVQILIHDNDKIEIGQKLAFDYNTNCFTKYYYNSEYIYGQKNFYIKVAKSPLYSINFDAYIVGKGTGKITIKFEKTNVVFSYDTTGDSPVIKLTENTSEYNASAKILTILDTGIKNLTDNDKQKGVKVKFNIENIYDEENFEIDFDNEFEPHVCLATYVDKSLKINRIDLDYNLISKKIMKEKIEAEAYEKFNFDNVDPLATEFWGANGKLRLVWHGTPKYKNDLFNQSPVFNTDGSGYLLSNTSATAWNSGSFWFKPEDLESENKQYILGRTQKSNGFDAGYHFSFMLEKNVLYFYSRNAYSSFAKGYTLATLNEKKWYNLYWLLLNKHLIVYLDGIKIFDANIDYSDFGFLFIGADFKGQVDEIYLFQSNGLLTEDEIKLLATPSDLLCDQTVKYKLNVKDLNIFYDNTDTTNVNFTNTKLDNVYAYMPFDINTLDIMNNTKAEVLGIEQYEKGIIWNSLVLNNNIIKIENRNDISTFLNNFQKYLNFWFKVEDNKIEQVIFETYKENNPVFTMKIKEEKIQILGKSKTGNSQELVMETPINKGWYQITNTKVNDTTYYFYLNGDRKELYNFTFEDEGLTKLVIGASAPDGTLQNATNFAKGMIDELKVYKSSINLIEVLRLYNAMEIVPFIKNIIDEINNSCSFPTQVGNFKVNSNIDGNVCFTAEYETDNESKVVTIKNLDKLTITAPGHAQDEITISNVPAKDYIDIDFNSLNCKIISNGLTTGIPNSFKFSQGPMIKFGFNVESVVETVLYEIYKESLPPVFLYFGKEAINDNIQGYISFDNDINFYSKKIPSNVITFLNNNCSFDTINSIRSFLRGNINNSNSTDKITDFEIKFKASDILSYYPNFNVIFPIRRENAGYDTYFTINGVDEKIDFEKMTFVKLEYKDNQINVYKKNLLNTLQYLPTWELVDKINANNAIDIKVSTAGTHTDFNQYYGVYFIQDQVDKIINKIALMIQSKFIDCTTYWGTLKINKISVF